MIKDKITPEIGEAMIDAIRETIKTEEYRKEIKGYVGSIMEKNDIKLLDKLERTSDIKLRPYMDFDVIKKLK